jgi:hypothetical protein
LPTNKKDKTTIFYYDIVGMHPQVPTTILFSKNLSLLTFMLMNFRISSII